MNGAITPPGPLILVRKQHKVRVESQGPEVVLLLDDKLVFRANWKQAEHVGRAILGACMRARSQGPRSS